MNTSPAAIARIIETEVHASMVEEGLDTTGVKWTGAMYYLAADEITLYEFLTPGSWDGRTWYDESLDGSFDGHDIDTLRGIVH